MLDTLLAWKRRAWQLNEQGLVDDAIAALIGDLLRHDPAAANLARDSLRFALFHCREGPALRHFLLSFDPHSEARTMQPNDSEGPQRELAFPDADASYEERKNDVYLALRCVEPDLHLVQFVLMVFNQTDGGMRGVLKKTYRELGGTPYGLCCSKGKVRTTAAWAQRFGLVANDENVAPGKSQTGNSYWIDWSGIRDLVQGGRPAGQRRPTPAFPEHGGATEKHPPAFPEHGGATEKHPSSSFRSSSSESESESDQRGGENTSLRKEAGCAYRELPDFLAKIPELAAGWPRKVAPLPAGDLIYGAFAPRALSDLGAAAIVMWFRRQLAAPRPVLGDSEAELLLTLAAAKATNDLPREQVLKSRRAIFQSTVTRCIWHKCLHCLPEVRAYLDGALANFPQLLVHPDGPGERAQQPALSGDNA